MAMGNLCYAQGIECPYATVSGQCLDYIYDDYDICEMLGDKMPPKDLSSEDRRYWILKYYNHEYKRDELCIGCRSNDCDYCPNDDGYHCYGCPCDTCKKVDGKRSNFRPLGQWHYF